MQNHKTHKSPSFPLFVIREASPSLAAQIQRPSAREIRRVIQADKSVCREILALNRLDALAMPGVSELLDGMHHAVADDVPPTLVGSEPGGNTIEGWVSMIALFAFLQEEANAAAEHHNLSGIHSIGFSPSFH